jgi:RNA polymerase sigma factor (TIGR02999 family)
MTEASRHDVTELLLAWNKGDQGALDKIIPLVHRELHRRAKDYMRGERPGHTLPTTALVNEVYLRLVDVTRMSWQNRTHFFAVCAQLMRRILVDFARARHNVKRGGEVHPVSLDEAPDIAQGPDVSLVALDDALNSLAAIDPRKSKVVELRFFGGLSVEETAEVLRVSPDTVFREWRLAKVWLLREVGGKKGDEA